MKAAKENPGTAAMMGVGILGLGAFAALSGKDSSALMKKALYIALEKVLRDEATKVYPRLLEKVVEVASEGPCHVNIFAHSHGGMVTDKFLGCEEFATLMEEFDLSLRVFAGGCPIIVRQPSHEYVEVRQLHNKNDVISLLFSSVRRPRRIICKSLPGAHSSKMYAENLHYCM